MRASRVLIFVFVCGIALCVLAVPYELRAQAAVSLDQYRHAAAEALELTQQANMSAAPARTELLNRAADALDAVRSVQISPDATIVVDNSDLVTLIRETSKTETAIARLTALQDALAQPLVATEANDLAALRAILSQPPFANSANWYDDIVRAIQDFLSRLLSNTARGVFDARDILIVLALIAVAVVLIYFVLALRRNFVAEQALPPPLAEHDARTPTEAFDNAQRFINAGDYRSAVRQLYLATLLILDQRGRIKYDPTLTNREYLRQAANDTRAATALQPIVETFDRTWYGFEPISPEEFNAFRRRVEQVREL